jgi:hypothetical protein
MTICYGDQVHSFVAVLKTSPSELSLAVLNDFSRIFTASYNGSNITYELSPLLSQTFPIEYLFYDIQLITYPLEIVRQSLPTGIHIEESMEDGIQIRRILNGVDPFIVIHYTERTIEFMNIERGYNYTIEEL